MEVVGCRAASRPEPTRAPGHDGYDLTVFSRSFVAGCGGERTAPTTVVIIVDWNAGELVTRCLGALARQTVRPETVMVVDNASASETWRHVTPGSLPIEMIRLPGNSGFAAGTNRGIALVPDAEWVALLNPDAFPEPDWLERLLTAKNMPGPLLAVYWPHHLLLNLISLVWFTLRGQGRAIWSAKWDARSRPAAGPEAAAGGPGEASGGLTGAATAHGEGVARLRPGPLKQGTRKRTLGRMQGRSVIVTGATGLVGHYLLPLLPAARLRRPGDQPPAEAAAGDRARRAPAGWERPGQCDRRCWRQLDQADLDGPGRGRSGRGWWGSVRVRRLPRARGPDLAAAAVAAPSRRRRRPPARGRELDEPVHEARLGQPGRSARPPAGSPRPRMPSRRRAAGAGSAGRSCGPRSSTAADVTTT